MKHYVITGLHSCNPWSDRLNDPGAFVAQQVWQEFVRALDRFNFVDLSPAYPAVENPYLNLSMVQLRQIDVSDLKWPIRFH